MVLSESAASNDAPCENNGDEYRLDAGVDPVAAEEEDGGLARDVVREVLRAVVGDAMLVCGEESIEG